MSQVKTYDPKNIVLTVGGFIVSGYGPSSMVKAERNKDSFSLEKGAQGDGVRNKSADRSGKLTITLLQTSASNSTLSTFAAADEAKSGGIFPVLLKDLGGNTIWASAEAWVMKLPTGEFDDKAKERSWVIECDDLEGFEGGY